MKLLLVAIIVLVLLYCTRETCGQTFSTIIFPEGIDGANPIISAVENTENVTFFCEVTRISDGVQRQTEWTLINNGIETPIAFTSEGLGDAGFENYEVSQETSRSNFTILIFDETFDNNQIGCGSGGEIISIFDLRILSTPSLPVVNNVTGGSGVATLLIQVSNSGVINSADFNFIISIYENDQLFDTQTINPDSQYITGSMINAVITVNLEEGMYSFTVQSSNPYGMSEVTELTNEVVVRPATSITTSFSTEPTSTITSSVSMTMTTGTPTVLHNSDLKIGTIASIVISVVLVVIIVIVSLILIVVCILYKRKASEETTRRDKISYSGTNKAYGVNKDKTTEEFPLQPIPLERNIAYGEIKPSDKQQPAPVIYDTPLLLPQQQKQISHYEEIDDYI